VAQASEEQCEEWGEAGNEAAAQYQWPRVAERVLDVYRRVLEGVE
jgi:hypothetical protein